MAILNNALPKNLTEYPNSFKRQGSFPLEAYSVFYDIRDESGKLTKKAIDAAKEYASNITSSAISYVGQIISVIEDDVVNVYKIIDTEGTLELVGVTDWDKIEGKPDIITYSPGDGINITGDGNQKTISLNTNAIDTEVSWGDIIDNPLEIDKTEGGTHSGKPYLKVKDDNKSEAVAMYYELEELSNKVDRLGEADWSIEDSTAAGYIKNKPELKANGKGIYNGEAQAVTRDGDDNQANYNLVNKTNSEFGSFSYGRDSQYNGNKTAPLATGAYSAAFGEGIIEGNNRYFGAQGQSSFVAGQQCSAVGIAGAAFGRVSRASGQGSFTAGEYNNAQGSASVALGFVVKADAQGAVALGNNSSAKQMGGLSAGYFLKPPSDNNINGQVILGRYNDSSKTGLLLAVGNGTSDGDRKNAFEITEDGEVWFEGLDHIKNFTEGTIRDKVVTVEGSPIEKPENALDYAILNKVGFYSTKMPKIIQNIELKDTTNNKTVMSVSGLTPEMAFGAGIAGTGQSNYIDFEKKILHQNYHYSRKDYVVLRELDDDEKTNNPIDNIENYKVVEGITLPYNFDNTYFSGVKIYLSMEDREQTTTQDPSPVDLEYGDFFRVLKGASQAEGNYILAYYYEGNLSKNITGNSLDMYTPYLYPKEWDISTHIVGDVFFDTSNELEWNVSDLSNNQTIFTEIEYQINYQPKD